MTYAFELQGITKRFGRTTALSDVSVGVRRQSIVGLVGRNGSGKTTLLRHVTGMYLPTSGTCTTLGADAARLGPAELSRIGVVNQDDTLLGWMRVRQLVEYVSTFYRTWDRELEQHLIGMLQVDREARVGTLSPGDVQKVALVLATCHHPELLLLDEPLSDLDPVARQEVLTMLLGRFRTDEMTMVISSHMLHDLERVVDHIICLEGGRIVADAELDALKERYAEWIVTSRDGHLPLTYRESYVVKAEGTRQQARLIVRDAAAVRDAFAATYGAEVETRPLNLERIFLLLASGDSSPATRTQDDDRPVAVTG